MWKFALISFVIVTLTEASILSSPSQLPGPDRSQGFRDIDTGQTFFWHFSADSQKLSPLCNDSKTVLCIVKDDKVLVSNAGQLESVIEKQESGDHISLTFDNGQTCGDNQKRYKTRFDFFCPGEDSAIEEKFMFAKTGDPCMVNIFIWHSLSICTKNDFSGCVVETPDYRLDLAVLANEKFYDVFSDDKSRRFELNICQGVKSSTRCPDGAAVCEVSSASSEASVIIGQSWNTSVSYNAVGKDITLDYSSQSGNKATIKLVCDDGKSQDTFIQFTGASQKAYTFVARTKFACAKTPINCQSVDPITKSVYDLSALRASYEDWVVFDTRPEMKLREYHLSVCKPLSPALTFQCPGSVTGVCMTNKKTHESFNLGQATEDSMKLELKNDEDDVLILHYDDGSSCNSKYNYSSQIIFRCSNEDPGPRFYDSLDDCTYIFEWPTPEACPKKTVRSKGCTVRDNFFGHTFNISGLYSPRSDIKVGNFTVNVCGGLKSDACGKDAAICMGPGKTVASASSEVLSYNDGKMTLSYEGETCSGPTKYSTKIFLQCSHNAGGGQPELAFIETCNFGFIWKTELACPPFEEVDCTVADENGEIFDFSPLALTDANYDVPMGPGGDSIILNVCKSLVHSSSSKCPYKSAVCRVQKGPKDEVKFSNLGEAVERPFLDEHNRLVIKYSNGGICKETGTDETHISTKIIFNCRKDKKDSNPIYVEKIGCTYIFWWDHFLACPKNFSVTEDSCMVKDDSTGTTYDLRPLRNVTKGLSTVDKTGTAYFLQICSRFKNETLLKGCGSESSTCKLDASGRYENLGSVNDRLTIQNNEPVLHYDNGNLHTTVHFKCAPIQSIHEGKLVLLERVKNHYYFDYFTSLACPFTVSCEAVNELSTSDELSYDLSGLKNYDSDIETQTGNEKVYFSVCKPLLLKENQGCPYGSAICSKVIDANNVATEIRGYGVAVEPPFVKRDLEVIINYEGGSMCDKEKNIRYNSTIRFFCNPTVFPGKPLPDIPASDYSGCHHTYKWETMLACPNATMLKNYETSSDCRIFHEPFHAYLSLHGLKASEDRIAKRDNLTFFVQPCGVAKHCNGTICLKDSSKVLSLGKLASSQFLFDEEELRVQYELGDWCLSDAFSYSSEIRFACDREAKNDAIEVLDVLPCHYILKWTTPNICQSFTKKPSMSTSGEAEEPSAGSASTSVSGVVITILFLALVGFLLYFKPQNRERAHDALVWLKTSVCLRRRPREDRSFLIESNVNIPAFGSLEVEDDDDLIIA